MGWRGTRNRVWRLAVLGFPLFFTRFDRWNQLWICVWVCLGFAFFYLFCLRQMRMPVFTIVIIRRIQARIIMCHRRIIHPRFFLPRNLWHLFIMRPWQCRNTGRIIPIQHPCITPNRFIRILHMCLRASRCFRAPHILAQPCTIRVKTVLQA